MAHQARTMLILATATALALAGCGGAAVTPSAAPATAAPTPAPSEAAESSVPASPAESSAPSPAALTDAKTAALRAANGQQLGGTVSMLGVLGGEELDRYLTMIAPFEEATGVDVQYEGTRDQVAVLQTRVDGGNPPDLVVAPSVGLVLDYERQGKVQDLSKVLDMTTTQQDFDANLLDFATVDGKLLGLFGAVNIGVQVWYDPKTYQGPKDPATWDELDTWAKQTAASGTTPWCIGQGAGSASGFPGANMITDILLRQAGPDAYERWWKGDLAWTSPEVRKAFETYGSFAAEDSMVYGGRAGELATEFGASAEGLIATPPTCFLHPQSTFIFDLTKASHPDIVPLEDMDFFSIPDFDPAYAGYEQIAGEMLAMFNDTPQSQALVRYLASPEAGELLGKAGWLSSNKRVPSSTYSPVLAKASEALSGASSVFSYGNTLMPAAMSDAFWKATLDYVKDPSTLDQVLADLEAVRAEAYK